MKITRWQMFVAWLKQYATIDRFLVLILLISMFFHSINNAVLDIVVTLIQIMLLVCFIRFSVKERFYENLTKKQLSPFIVSNCVYVIVLETLNIIYGDLRTINFLIIFVAMILGVVVVCFDTKLTKQEYKAKSDNVDEVYIGYSEDKLHRYVVSLKNGTYEVNFEKFVQETLYNGEEYAGYEPIDLDNVSAHIFYDCKKAKEYGEQVLKDIK